MSRWIDTPDQVRNHDFICKWHYLVSDLEGKLSEADDLEESKRLNLLMLQIFYMEAYESQRDFYEQFEERLARWMDKGA